MPRVFVCTVAIVSVLTCTAHAQKAAEDRSIIKQSPNGGVFEVDIREKLFRKSFGNQRKEQAEAVKRLKKLENYERLYKMIMILGERMIDVIGTSQTLIEKSDFDPDNGTLPQNATIQAALSTILENTALFGDIVLHFPHVTHRILTAQRNWNTVINWSVNFANRSRHFLDDDTRIIIRLMEQELGITEREPGYFNPYWPAAESREKEDAKRKRSSKKEKRKRGPQMTKIEL